MHPTKRLMTRLESTLDTGCAGTVFAANFIRFNLLKICLLSVWHFFFFRKLFNAGKSTLKLHTIFRRLKSIDIIFTKENYWIMMASIKLPRRAHSLTHWWFYLQRQCNTSALVFINDDDDGSSVSGRPTGRLDGSK